MRNCFYSLILLLIPNLIWSQTRSWIGNQKMQVGEQTEIMYELELGSEKDKVRFEPKMGLISCDVLTENSSLTSKEKVNVEIIDVFRDSISEGKPLKWIGKYKVVVWDTGEFKIPAPHIVLNDSTFNFQDITFEVIPTKLIDGQGIYEVEMEFMDIQDDPFYYLKKYIGWIIFGVLCIIALLFFLFRRKKKPPVPVKEISLKEKTLLAIESLNQAKLWEKGEIKQHYIELSYILRSYLGVRYELNLLERTSDQTRILLIAQGLSQDTVETIKLILDQSDMVKFAKSAPQELEIFKISALAKQIVSETSPIEFDHVQ